MPNLDLSQPFNQMKWEQFIDALTGDGVMKGISYIEATLDPPSLATGADGSATATVNGAAVGDGVLAFAPYDMQEIMKDAAVSAANTVEVSFYNTGAGTVNLASGTWRFLVFHNSVS